MALLVSVRDSINYRATRHIPNPTLTWHGDAEATSCHLVRIGDCSWQAIQHGHTFGPVGYPKIFVDELRALGAPVRFTNVYAGTALAIQTKLLAQRVPETADAIIVQMGIQHAVRELLPLADAGIASVRIWANWRLGPEADAVHRRIVAPALRRWGRLMIDPSSLQRVDEQIGLLATWLRANRPRASCVVVLPHLPVLDGWADPRRVVDARRTYRTAAKRHGLTTVDYARALKRAAGGRDSEFFGATGYDLRAPGHEIVADVLRPWLTDAFSHAYASPLAGNILGRRTTPSPWHSPRAFDAGVTASGSLRERRAPAATAARA
jgi:hypothetical protein